MKISENLLGEGFVFQRHGTTGWEKLMKAPRCWETPLISGYVILSIEGTHKELLQAEFTARYTNGL
jgi:hypothetical protein